MADIKPCQIAEPHQPHSWEQHVVEQLRSYGLYHHCPGVGFPDSMEDLENAIAKVIWEASRADEGSISATGANIVARSLIAHGFGTPWPSSPQLVVDGVAQDPTDPLSWRIAPSRVMEVPEPPEHPLKEVLERIAEAIENSGPDNDALSSIAGALDDIERQGR